MSEPGLAILLPRELEFVDYPQLAKFAKVKFKKAFRQEKTMKFHTGTPPCCICLHLEAPQTELYNIDELARIERYFEFTPKQCMQIYAVSSCDGCHRALGNFAIKIAKHFKFLRSMAAAFGLSFAEIKGCSHAAAGNIMSYRYHLPENILAKDTTNPLSPSIFAAAPSRTALQQVLKSRAVFYPGSGVDWHALRLFGRNGAAHCFIHADLALEPEYALKKLSKKFARKFKFEIESYAILEPEQLESILPAFDHSFSCLAMNRWFRRASQISASRDALWCVLRKINGAEVGDTANRLFLLHARAEAIWLYGRLWTSRNGCPYGIVLQDHGFGGNWTHFGGQQSPLAHLARMAGRHPDWLLVGPRTDCWYGYEPASSYDRPGGMHGDLRMLYQRASYRNENPSVYG